MSGHCSSSDRGRESDGKAFWVQISKVLDAMLRSLCRRLIWINALTDRDTPRNANGRKWEHPLLLLSLIIYLSRQREKKGNESKIKKPHMGRGNCIWPPNHRYLCSYTLGNNGGVPSSTFIRRYRDNDGPTSGNDLDTAMPRTLCPKGIDLLSRKAPALFHLLNSLTLNSLTQPACRRLAWWQVRDVLKQESFTKKQAVGGKHKPGSLPRGSGDS